MYFVPFAQRNSNRCWCYIFWLLPRRFAHGPSPSGHAASTTFSGTGIPPWAQISTLLLALSPMPRCLEALRILFGCCSMALVPSTTCHAACYGLLSGCLFSGCAAFGLPFAPLTLLLPASPLAIYSVCPLHSGIRTGAGVMFFGFCHGVSPCRHGFRGRCFHMRPWAFGPPAIDCEPCHEVWPSGLSCSGSCRQLVDLNCPSARRGCPCGFRALMSAILSCIFVSLMAPVGVASICRLCYLL